MLVVTNEHDEEEEEVLPDDSEEVSEIDDLEEESLEFGQPVCLLMDTGALLSCIYGTFYNRHCTFFRPLQCASVKLVGTGDSPMHLLGDTASLLLHLKVPSYAETYHSFPHPRCTPP